MDLRCLVFSGDAQTAEPVCQVLAELDAEAEHCPEAVSAAERVAKESFQLVVVDWDQQTEAELILKATRGRKANERPLTLAIVSADTSIPKALQAGANSILRKPILLSQVKDTLETARSLLKARSGASTAGSTAANAAPAPDASFSVEAPNDAHLRAGEFLQSTGPAPASQIDTESEMQKSLVQSAANEVDPLKDLEPMAAEVAPLPVVAAQPPSVEVAGPDEPRGLQWYLNQRAAKVPQEPIALASPPSPEAPAAAKPELLAFDQTPHSHQTVAVEEPSPAKQERQAQEQKQEAELFAYISEGKEPEQGGSRSFRLGKGPILFALVLAAVAIVAAPQAPWHPQIRVLWSRGRVVLHAWLNPQPVAPAQSPPSHESFGRAGDEYKLPVAEAIPDATTDPSQIRVVPMIDPTAKKPNGAGTADPNASPEGAVANPTDSGQGQNPSGSPQPQEGMNSGTASPGDPVSPTQPAVSQSSEVSVSPVALSTGSSSVGPTSSHADPMLPPPVASVPVATSQPRSSVQPRPASTSATPPIPSSLKSQMASMAPEASGNKAPETALPSIEPVEVPEATERALMTAQPNIAYPASAKGQQGTVVLLVLIGRDGTVQDAKFLQGSLAFARSAIDGVKQWTFKPYSMNGRPVSVQTKLTLGFRPGQ